MKILTRNEDLKKALERYFFYVVESRVNNKKLEKFTILDSSDFNPAMIAECIKDLSDGWFVAVANYYGFTGIKEDFLLKRIFSCSNTGSFDLLKMSDIIDIINSVGSVGEKKPDKSVLEAYNADYLSEVVRRIRHGKESLLALSYSEMPEVQKRAIVEEGRRCCLPGTDEEIFNFVKNWCPNGDGQYSGKFLKGFFVDALDTLFDKDWVLKPIVYAKVKEISEGKEISVISDGNYAFLRGKLSDNGIDWPIFSKHDLRGVELEFVVDNLSCELFTKAYNINCRKFINVADL